MASDEVWKKLNWFKKESTIDNWGDPEAIDENLLFKLDHLRTFLGTPIVVSSGVRDKKGAGKSYHFKEYGACAVDVVFPQYEKSAFDLILDVTRFHFGGLGFYPDWRFKDHVVGGLHLDVRPVEMGARWMGIIGPDGKRKYIELSLLNLMKYAMDDIGAFQNQKPN